MEIILSTVGIIISILVGLITLALYKRMNRQIKDYGKKLGRGLTEMIKELDPKKKYIIALPASMSETDFDVAFGVMRDYLALESADTHIVIMHGDVTMIEFS